MLGSVLVPRIVIGLFVTLAFIFPVIQAVEISLTKTEPHSLMHNNGKVSIVMKDSNENSASRQRVDIFCEPKKEVYRRQIIVVNRQEYMVYCEPLDVVGDPTVSILVYTRTGLFGVVQRHTKITTIIAILWIVSLHVALSFSILSPTKFAKINMFLRRLLIKQIEVTQQAEIKSMNMNLAFASASHDVRSSLAALDGIINLCNAEVDPKSEMHMNLEHMNTSIADLVGLLNSVLDMSKIEAGKMQLTEQEFSLADMLEESINLYYHVANDKGIDLVLDPCDGSVVKHPLVTGDRGKLKQIMNNLLHNAIKFTSDGHIVVRSWIIKPSPQTTILTSEKTGVWKCFSRFLCKNDERDNPFNSLQVARHNQNLVEFLTEVDDTGVGIPREKQKRVFEDFVQVKETALSHGGTGLGLGIVRSLVRLMGGDIEIVDKRFNERGNCFRFNIFLSTSETAISATEGEDLRPNQILELNIQSVGPTPEGSHVVLFMKGSERQRAVKKFFQSVGAKVSGTDTFEHVSPLLEWIKQKWRIAHPSYSGQSELGSSSDSFSTLSSRNLGTMELCINMRDGIDNSSLLRKRTGSKGALGFVLIIIDFSAAHFSDEQFLELYWVLENFRKDINDIRCKVVWLYTPKTDIEARRLDEKKLAKCDLVMSKPLHGSRLYQLLKLIPEFGGAMTIPGYGYNFTEEAAQTSNGPQTSIDRTNVIVESSSSNSKHRVEIENVDERSDAPNGDKILAGKKVLVAEDVMVLRKVAIKILERHEAIVECCQNGEEAVTKVRNALLARGKGPGSLPYDIIFMDCQMPILDGYEATRQIRLEEKLYDVHFPIIALTAHAEIEEETKILQAGMDIVITKPLNSDNLSKAIHDVNIIYKEA